MSGASHSQIMRVILVLTAACLLRPRVTHSQIREWAVYNTANSGIPDNRVAGVGIDRQGNVWTGHGSGTAIGAGCAKFDGRTWTVYNTRNSGLPHDNVRAFAFDRQGHVWLGTGGNLSSGGGLAEFDGVNWTAYNQGNSGLPNDNISSLAFSAEGDLWIGTQGGVARFDGKSWTTYSAANSALPGNVITSLAIDAHGGVWAGIWGGGLACFTGESWTAYNSGNSGLPSNHVIPVVVDPRDNVWIGTFEAAAGGDRGLVRFDGETWTVYNTQNSGLSANGIWSLAVDGRGTLWAGCVTEKPPILGGLVRYDGEDWRVYNATNSSLPNDWVFSLATDPQGAVWIGTMSSGLAVYRPIPPVDFSGDERVDIEDLLILIESWGQSDPVTDIAPSPSGDGVVDRKDLELLMEYWGQEIFNPALIAYWKLDEAQGTVAYDSAGENDADVLAGALWQPEGGRVGGAIELDGTNDHVSTPFVVNPADGPFSVFAWVKDGAPAQVIVCQAGGDDWLLADPSAGRLMTTLQKPRGRTPVPPLVSEVVITDGQWHRVGLAWNGTDRILYVDDLEVACDTQAAPAESTEGLCLGCDQGENTGTFWTGLIDDVRVYNRAVKP